MKFTKFLRVLPIYLILIGGSLIMFYPLAYTFLGSFMPQAEYIRSSGFPFPTSLYLTNYQTLIQPKLLPVISGWLGVTLLRIVWYCLIPTVVAVLCGYVFARLHFWGREAAFMTLLGSLLVPGIVFQVPLYVMLARWPLAGGNDLWGQGGHGFIGQLPSMLMPGLVNAFAIFLMRQAYYTIPKDYDEAARIDGANTLQVMWYIFLPMLTPTIMVIVITTFVATWNDYTWPLMAVGANQEIWPIGLAFQKLIAGSFPILSLTTTTGLENTAVNISLVLAAGTLVTLPPVLCFFFFQRYFIEGLQGVGIK